MCFKKKIYIYIRAEAEGVHHLQLKKKKKGLASFYCCEGFVGDHLRDLLK